jgi:ABC-type sugar transport system ATPase subunit
LESYVRFSEVSKEFPGVVALNRISFDIKKGEVHGLVGENGAGKSTLVNILAGAFTDYTGKIFIDGKEAEVLSSAVSEKLGICTVFQDSNVIPTLDVPTNVFLGREPTAGKLALFLDKKKRQKETQKLLNEKIRIKMDIKRLVRDLSISERQIIGIMKGLVSNAEIFILDEPTSSLTRSEISNLFKIIRDLKQSGKTIVFISHRLDEIFEITDSITVLRDGHHIVTDDTRNFSQEDLINSMVGRKIESRYPRTASYHDEVVLEIRDLSRKEEFYNISLKLHRGEILGLAGVIGAGRTEVVKTVFGYTKKSSGQIYVKGKEVDLKTPRDAIKLGIGLLTEDRRNESLILVLDVLRNILMSKLQKACKYKLVNYKKARKYAREYVNMLEIKTPSLSQRVEFLSGGNQQKVVFSKWLFADSEILILDEPTKGIDVGAKFEIYKIINRLSERGVGIILISSEIPELIGLCHTIAVMHEGKMIKTLINKEVTQDMILSLALGESGETT